jgi:hypothetical protein
VAFILIQAAGNSFNCVPLLSLKQGIKNGSHKSTQGWRTHGDVHLSCLKSEAEHQLAEYITTLPHTTIIAANPSVATFQSYWATCWTIGVLGFDSRQELGIFLFTTVSRTNKQTNKMIPRIGVLLEALNVTRLAKKFPAFYGTIRFITVFTKAHTKQWVN